MSVLISMRQFRVAMDVRAVTFIVSVVKSHKGKTASSRTSRFKRGSRLLRRICSHGGCIVIKRIRMVSGRSNNNTSLLTLQTVV